MRPLVLAMPPAHIENGEARHTMQFVKQYGERRTATNYLRALLLANYPSVMPLMHVLGDKHSEPVELDVYLREARRATDPDWEFVRSATMAVPAESTRAGDSVQVEYLKNIAPSVARGAREGTIGFAISARHPYAWAPSWRAIPAGWSGGASRRTWTRSSSQP